MGNPHSSPYPPRHGKERIDHSIQRGNSTKIVTFDLGYLPRS
jgi:hypothetical protein